MNRRRLVLSVNGGDHEVWVLPSDTLLDVLHDELGLADVRYGCGEGVCGTCTVLLDGEPVNGCLILAVQAAGRPVTTLPGMVLTALDLVRRRGRTSREEIRYALVGNLCRCTGYTKILDAVEEYADQAADTPDGVPS
jgi:carbon-monoxide dehydrogenase small subunit